MNKSFVSKALLIVLVTVALWAMANPANATLLRYYKMDEASGTSIVDDTGHFNGTYNGGPSLGQSSADATKYGTAVGFTDGSYGSLGVLWQNQGYDVSLAAWVAPSAAEPGGQDSGIIGGHLADQWEWCLANDGRVKFVFGSPTPTPYYSTNAVTSFDGKWVHLGLTYDHMADQLKVYKNGALVETISTTVGMYDMYSAATTYYLAGTAELSFTGKMDEVHIWNDVEPLSTFQTLATVTPEPSACALSVSAIIGLLAYAWRKRKMAE